MWCKVIGQSVDAFGGRARHPEMRGTGRVYGLDTSGDTIYLLDLSEEEIAAYGDRLPKIAPVDVLDRERFEAARQARLTGNARQVGTRLPEPVYQRLSEYARTERISLNLAMVRAVERLLADN